jgi:hypothetical protein
MARRDTPWFQDGNGSACSVAAAVGAGVAGVSLGAGPAQEVVTMRTSSQPHFDRVILELLLSRI